MTIFLVGGTSEAVASDACSTTSVAATADVSVSDGSSFTIESLYHTPDHAAIHHEYEEREDQVIAVEGPIAWARSGSETTIGSNFYKVFALGHQYHAFLLYFGDILANVRESDTVEFRGERHSAMSGDYPYGGTVHSIRADSGERSPGLVFDFGDDGRIEASLSDWRAVGDQELPFIVTIDDGRQTFEYRYTAIDIEPRSPLWFFEALPAPAIGSVEVHRLHRTLLAAHCLGDADRIASHSAESVLSANRGVLSITANEDLRDRFTSLFEQLDYREYHDIVEPVIRVSERGDMGWIAVQVRAIGNVVGSDQSFDNQWAWVMTAEKVDGKWRHTGNASNVVE